jgi:hypothetical protein
MTPQELQYVQIKIGSSFLRSFYPADYRAMMRTEDRLIKLENEEYKRLRTTSNLTSEIDKKMARTIGLLQREINELLAALDSTQSAIYMIGDEMVDAEALDEAMQRTAGGFDLFKSWRQIDRVRRILRSREKRIERKRLKEKAKADQIKKDKKASDDVEKARKIEEENARRARDSDIQQKKPSADTTPEPLPKNKSLATVTEDFVNNPSSVTEGAFKEAVKKSTNPKSVMSALKSAKSAYMAFDAAASRTLSKILGSKLIRWGGLAAIAVIETWAGWEEYVMVMEAYEKGYISMAMKNTLVRNIIATHAVTGVASLVFGAIGTSIGALIGAPALGIGALVGGIIGGIIGGGFGAIAAEYLVEILLENKTFSDYFDDVINAASESMGGESGVVTGEQTSTIAPASVPPAPSIVSRETQDVSAPSSFISQAAAATIDSPINANEPETRALPAAVPSPVNVESPDISPSVEVSAASSTAIDPNKVRDSISNQLASTALQHTHNASDATMTGNDNQQEPLSSEVQMDGGVAGANISSGSVKVVEMYGRHRPGRPIAKIRQIAVSAAERVGMTQINFTSGVGSWISSERRQGGQKTTRHSHGDALDVTGFDSENQAVAFMQTARQLGAGGIGYYNDGSVHIDLGNQREWDRAKGIPGLADGGKIHPKDGGTLTLVAEAGEPEYVVPQSKVENFAHEMLAARPSSRNKTKKHTHVMVVPIYT